MSISKKHLSQARTRGRVVMTYRSTELTQQQIADRFNLSIATVIQILREDVGLDERVALKARRYSISKKGEKNPALGRKPGNYIGNCADGRGYLTQVVRGKRYFTHRIVAASMLGIDIEHLPPSLHVHHIDEIKTNNSRDNLAIATSRGHRKIHQLSK